MKNKVLVTFVTLLFTTSSFAGRVQLGVNDNKVTVKDVLSVWSEWIKDKGKKFDINIHLQNESDQGIIIQLSEIRCHRGGAQGELKHTFFNTGEKVMDFKPHEQKSFNLVCKIGQETKGEYKLTVGTVYANPSGDGKTLGKPIAKNIEWKVKIAEE